MKASIRQKLEKAEHRFEELAGLLADPEILRNSQHFRDLSVEYARLQPTASAFADYRRLEQDLSSAEGILTDADSDMRALGQEEITAIRGRLDERDTELQRLLLPRDPHDERNIFLEIRAGTGGDEAAIFAGDLLRMYSRYAEAQGWQIETLNESPGEHGGYREVICRIVGRGGFSRLKFESGTHRVQRVPATEAQGRVHTSAVTVAILPELDEIDKIEINPADLRIDTYRSSGAGGQHVNKTDSALRITHLPSGIVVSVQNERSQHQNKAKAMQILGAKLAERARHERKAEMNALSGDRGDNAWGNQIRSYVLAPYQQVKDLRTGYETGNVAAVLDGDLDGFMEAELRRQRGSVAS